jgi:polysaccharide export outer membrane protein
MSHQTASALLSTALLGTGFASLQLAAPLASLAQHQSQLSPHVRVAAAPPPLPAITAAPIAAAQPLPTTPAPAGTESTSNPAYAQEDQYILGPSDVLNLRFLTSSSTPQADTLSGPLTILPDGTASLPLLGSVRLSGLTLSQASMWLQSLYKKQLLRPELQLTLTQSRPLRIAVLGEVERPGIYTLTNQEASATEARVPITGLPTIVDAIQKAGGVTNLADLTSVTLRRQMPGEQAAYRRTTVDLLALIRDGDMIQNPLLFDGDIIRVAKAPETVPEAIELSSTTLSPVEITVNVVGEVKSPGPVQLPANTPLVQAVLAAGGPQTWRANTGRVQLIRINRNGSLTRRAFQLNLGSAPTNTNNPPLRDRDTIVITRSNYAKLTDGIDAITKPLTGLASVLSLIQIVSNTSR